MMRESDEECLALIATIRERRLPPLRNETERLLDNLEARIAESRADCHCLCDTEACQRENARLRGQLADLGAEFVKLTGEIERLNSVCVIKDDEIERLRARLTVVGEMNRQMARDSFRDLRKSGVIIGVFDDNDVLSTPEELDEKEQPTTIGEPASPEVCEEFGRAQREDCPCGTESCREAWRELREAAASAKAEVVAPTRAEPPIRDIIREEVQSYGAAEACRQHVREEVAAEVARQLEERIGVPQTIWTWINNVQHEIDKLRAALEAKAS